MTPDLLSVIVRALGFVALFQAVGAGFFLALFGDCVPGTRSAIRRVGLLSAACGAVLILAHLALDAARLSGDFGGLRDPDLQALAWTGRSGIAQLVQVMGLLGVAIGLWKFEGRRARWASCGGVVAIAGFLITGHTSNHPWRLVLGPLLALHLLVVAFWFGALIPLVLVIRCEEGHVAAGVLRRFSVIAGWLVPLILVAGLTMAWLLAGSLAILHTPYGELLVVKVAGFGLLMVLAAGNRWRLIPAFGEARTHSTLSRSIAAETLLIVALLSVTAVLTAFFSPR